MRGREGFIELFFLLSEELFVRSVIHRGDEEALLQNRYQGQGFR